MKLPFILALVILLVGAVILFYEPTAMTRCLELHSMDTCVEALR